MRVYQLDLSWKQIFGAFSMQLSCLELVFEFRRDRYRLKMRLHLLHCMRDVFSLEGECCLFKLFESNRSNSSQSHEIYRAMTDNIKVISRPKVRFCQFSDDARNKVDYCKEQAVVRAPRVVALKKPIRLVDKSIGIRDISLSNCNISSHYGIVSGNVSSSSDNDVTRIENTMILRHANGIQNTDEGCKMSQLDKSPRDDVPRDCAKRLRQKGKENKNVPLKRALSSKSVNDPRMGNSQRIKSIIREKFKLSTGDDDMEKVNVVRPVFKRPKLIKSQSAPSIAKRTKNLVIQEGILNAKPVTTPSRVTSRYKNKISPVKKIILRNVSGSKIKTAVRPGIFCKEQNVAKTSANERHTVISDITVDLVQPEYNSIIRTVNKLKELEQQKIVTNISHLPSTLKNFLHGKISTALDFPLDEVIYKNLVDLNIDERQLPSIITRSKDPEPRQKDIVPKLSDFFIPENTKEICEAVHIKSRALKIYDNWNAFKISDRILEWKYSIDDTD